MLYATGVGSRKAPRFILELMNKVVHKMSVEGWIWRTGDACGVDSAIRKSAKVVEIYTDNDATAESRAIAGVYHKAWNMLTAYAKDLHGRNVLQVLGSDMKIPSKLLICWTPDGCKTHRERTVKTGGTGTAISIADANNIKIFNLANLTDYNKVTRYIR